MTRRFQPEPREEVNDKSARTSREMEERGDPSGKLEPITSKHIDLIDPDQNLCLVW